MYVEDFVYQLPQNLIARYPARARSQSRLLCLQGEVGAIEHRLFHSFPDLLDPGDLLVLNDTRVIPARLYGKKFSGGCVEILVERILSKHEALVRIKHSKKVKSGASILLESGQVVDVLERKGSFFRVRFQSEYSVKEVLDRHGHMPLPPYLHRMDEGSDKQRYQTVYARECGATSAPSAGLHFDKAMLETLQKNGVEVGFVTLHVGVGTFQPVRVDRLSDHKMLKENIKVSSELCAQVKATRARGGAVVAVGTTTARCLETAAFSGTLEPYEGETDLFIYPGYSFRVVDGLLTNFQLPGSTLLMLMCAFAGRQRVLEAYRVAVENRYRFYSYGDAIFYKRPK